MINEKGQNISIEDFKRFVSYGTELLELITSHCTDVFSGAKEFYDVLCLSGCVDNVNRRSPIKQTNAGYYIIDSDGPKKGSITLYDEKNFEKGSRVLLHQFVIDENKIVEQCTYKGECCSLEFFIQDNFLKWKDDEHNVHHITLPIEFGE